MSRRYKCTWWVITDDPLVWNDSIGSPTYQNVETGEKVVSYDLPFGALFELNGDGYQKGYDGKCIVCKIPYESPGYTNNYIYWYIDSVASNCNKKDDYTHRCWIRHGSVGETVHVDKNGNTCNAGAGSIAVSGFHGFLHNGELYEC